MRRLSDSEFDSARETVKFARDQIKANLGKCGYKTIDKFAGYAGSFWSQKLLKCSRKWSCNEALALLESLKRCEQERTTKKLCQSNGNCSPDELRRRYINCPDAVIGGAEQISTEPLWTVEGGANDALTAYDAWFWSHADYATISSLEGAIQALLYRQIAGAKTKSGQPYSCAILYEPGAADMIASEIARYLADENVITGAPKYQHKVAYDALIKLFASENSERSRFGDECEFAFWSFFRRHNFSRAMELQSDMTALVASTEANRRL